MSKDKIEKNENRVAVTTKEKESMSWHLKDPAAVSAEKLIILALEKGVPMEVVEKVFALRTTLRDEFARNAFFNDMALAQLEMPVIERKTPGAKTKSGEVAYHYAQLGDIAKAVQPILHKYGFSYLIRASQAEKGVKVTCVVMHQAGHREESTVEFPMTTATGVMSAPQVVAATMTFAKRYAFCNAFGIMTAEEDNENVLTLERGKQTEAFVFRHAKEKIEKASDDDLKIQVEFLRKELAKAQKFEAGEEKDAPSLGLRSEQYKELIEIAEQKLAGKSTDGDPARDDAGFAAHQAAMSEIQQ